MYLQRVYLAGFKSFADPTTIELRPGLTVFVGPNGSGKSNVVDAIRWALAAGTTHDLRAARQEELLFQGSPGRRPAQLAEVRLTFEHQGELHFPQAEVTISRRLYADGQAEVRLNGVPCRRRDVVRVFAGSGLGPEGCAIIGQGHVDAVLSQGPSQRLALLEEAAGASPYREERRVAVAELARADEALARVVAVMEELAESRAPLAREVERLAGYERLRAELYALEVSALRHRHRQAASTEAELVPRLGEAEAECARLGEVETRLGSLRDAVWALGQDLSLRLVQLDEAIGRAHLAEQQRHARAEALGERQAALARALAREQEALLEARERAAALAARVAELEEELRHLSPLAARWQGLPAELRLAPHDWRQIVAQEQERRRELARQKEELERQAGERAQRSAELAAALRESQQALAALEGEWQAACSALDACRTNLRRLEGERRAAEERYLRPGPRAVLEAQRAGALSGVVGLLGELVTAPAELSLALDVALGGQFDAVVTACEEDAERAIAFLRAERIGTATFLPLPLLRPRPHPRHVPRGALGWLTDLITVEPALRPAAEAVLGGILVVPDLETAFAVARSSGSRPRLVTQKGEQLFPSGSVTGGFIHPRRARLPDLSAAREDVARWEERAHALGARREALQERCRVLAAEGKGLEAEEERARVALAALDDLLAELDGRVARLVAESRQAEELAQALSAREELLRLSGRLEEERSLLAGAERAREEAQSRLRQAEEELSAVAASLVAVEEQGQAGRAAALSRRRDAVRRLERALNALARHLEAVLRRATLLRTRRLAEVERWREEAERAGAEARAALARLEQEFGASPEGPAQAVPERRLHELRRELQALGPVRPACREELETLDSRLAALAEERRDLTLAKERLLRTMARADEELQRRVRQALVRCQAAFQEIFAELFGGGEGTLCLGAEGLEVEARLPGKHLRRLSLLSGGERSLIALAFLLALVRLRPTPVQVLDEADASLDEENVARLLRFLTRRGGEQYLLISHQRATMEAADVLVGLVMQEPGVTTVVEVELDAGSEGPVGSVAGGA